MRAKILTLSVAIASSAAPLHAETVARVAAMDVEDSTGGLPPKLVALFNEFLQGKIRARGYDVIGSSDVRALLGVEQMQQRIGCNETSCLTEIAGALDADEVVTGAIGTMDGELYLSIKRTSRREARVLAQSTRIVRGAPEKGLMDSVSVVVADLYGPPPHGPLSDPADDPSSVPDRDPDQPATFLGSWGFWTGAAVVVGSVVAVGLVAAQRGRDDGASKGEETAEFVFQFP